VLPLLAAFGFAGACFMRDPAPRQAQLDPSGGWAPLDFDASIACGRWDFATVDLEAKKHVSFAEKSPESCWVPVDYEGSPERISAAYAPRPGCGYPRNDTKPRLLARAAVYDSIAKTGEAAGGSRLPLEIACELPAEIRRRAAAQNGRAIRSYAATLADDDGTVYPYAIASTFGYGAARHGASKLLGWAPGDPCRPMEDADRELLDVNVQRAARIAAAWQAGIAPFVSTSGGAVHGPLIEAFMLAHLASCDGGVPMDRILVDPCADHTHTNVRNTGAMVVGIGARTAYVVTDDGIQSDYLQEWTAFELVGGSIDQRARRDWGYLVGAWRQASRGGMDAGFWFTPYRFWAEPEAGLGSFHCVGDVLPE
jgi:hypothetical protein